MPTNDREVFEELTGGNGPYPAVDFLTYALFAFERREWINHRTLAKGGTPPTQAEIDAWIADVTPYQFDQMRSRAAATFDVAARQYMAADIEQARQDTLQGAVVREVKAAGAFWRQLSIALITAILAPIIIGGVLVFALSGEKAIPTIGSIKDRLMPQEAPAKPESPR